MAVALPDSAGPLARHDGRHGATDVLRMTAVVPIVFYHAGVLADLPAIAGLNAMIAAAVFFAGAARRPVPARQIVGRRASRLLVPWLFFALLHAVMAARNHVLRPWMLFAGGSLHLWFVPFIFVVTCAVALASRGDGWPKGWGRAIGWAVAALAAIHFEARFMPAIARYVPAGQWLDGTTAVLAALAAMSVPTGRRGAVVFTAALMAISVAVWVPWRGPGMMCISPAGLGTLLFLLVAMLPGHASRTTNFLGRASFGLYLMHPMVTRLMELAVAAREHIPAERLGRPSIALSAGMSVVICVAAVAVLIRTPARRVVA